MLPAVASSSLHRMQVDGVEFANAADHEARPYTYSAGLQAALEDNLKPRRAKAVAHICHAGLNAIISSIWQSLSSHSSAHQQIHHNFMPGANSCACQCGQAQQTAYCKC
jgi:hypothetical protein